MHDISTSDAHPSIARVSDAKETAFSLCDQEEVEPRLDFLLDQQGNDEGPPTAWLKLDEICLSFIGYEGGKAHVPGRRRSSKTLWVGTAGSWSAKVPASCMTKRSSTPPYIRDFLLDRGAIGDVSELQRPWSKTAAAVHQCVGGCPRKVYAHLGVAGWIMCHLSHSYHSGACLYFTFAFKHDGIDPLGSMSRSRTPSSRRSSTQAARCRTTTQSALSMPPGWSRTSRRLACT